MRANRLAIGEPFWIVADYRSGISRAQKLLCGPNGVPVLTMFGAWRGENSQEIFFSSEIAEMVCVAKMNARRAWLNNRVATLRQEYDRILAATLNPKRRLRPSSLAGAAEEKT